MESGELRSRLHVQRFLISRDFLGSLHWLEGKIEITPRKTVHRQISLCLLVKMGSTTNEELENLSLNLKKVQEKFLNEWTGESFRKARLEDKENHENMLTGGKGICDHEGCPVFCQTYI